jgi:membrane protease YdiL (CAAX protease family)
VKVWLAYVVLLYSVWAGVELGLDGLMTSWWGSAAAGVVHSFLVKPMIWAVPAVALIVRYRSAVRVRLREMLCLRRADWLRALAVVVVLTVYVLALSWPRWSAEDHRLDISLVLVARVLVSVGVCEELAFRGWLMNAMPGWRTWWGYALNGALFALIHVPTWIERPNQLAGWMAIQTPLFSMVLGAVMAWLFARSRSLLASLIPHAWYDLIMA